MTPRAGILAILIVALAGCVSPVAPSIQERPMPEPKPCAPPATRAVTAGNEYDGVLLDNATPAATGGALSWRIAVDEDASVRSLTPLLFGYNHVWHINETLMARAGAIPTPEFLAAAADIPMPLNRMSGTDSQDFHWKDAIGPMAERKPQSVRHRPPAGPPRLLGPLEWVRICEDLDPQARFSWTFNFWKEEPEDHADLAEFLTGEPGRNLDGGIDWAARRVACGRTAPVPVAIWELANEIDWDSEYLERFPDADAYVAYCRRTIAAVRQVQPAARFAAHAATAAHSPKWATGDWRTWHRRVLAGLGGDLDWIVFHPYYHGLPIVQQTGYLDQLRDDIVASGHPRIGIYLSEHARWPERPKDGPWHLNWHQTHDLSGCLSTAQFFCRMIQRSEVTAAAYHCYSGGPWSLVRDRDATNQVQTPIHATGMAVLHQFMQPFHRGQVVASSSAGERTDPTARDATADIAAALGEDGRLRLLLVNREPLAAREVTVALRGRWQLAGGELLTAPGLDAVNTHLQQPIRRTPVAAAPGAFGAWILPARSAAILVLERLDG